MAKFRAGDEVTVRGTIHLIDTNDTEMPLSVVVTTGKTPIPLWVAESAIVTHTPKPREFVPGDMVTWGNGVDIVEFIAAKDGYAIMWHKNFAQVCREPLSDIRHADEAD